MDQNHSKRNQIADPSKGKLGLFFVDFWGKFLETKLGGWGVKFAETKGC
jgi:hypothetical protein